MAVENVKLKTYDDAPISMPGLGGVPVIKSGSLELSAAASVNSQYYFFKVPINARILGLSKLYFDDLASTGAPTLAILAFPLAGQFTSVGVVLNDAIAVSAAAGSASAIKDIANYGKTLWELVGLTSNPGGYAGIVVKLLDAASDTGGTITMELAYSIDA